MLVKVPVRLLRHIHYQDCALEISNGVAQFDNESSCYKRMLKDTIELKTAMKELPPVPIYDDAEIAEMYEKDRLTGPCCE